MPSQRAVQDAIGHAPAKDMVSEVDQVTNM